MPPRRASDACGPSTYNAVLLRLPLEYAIVWRICFALMLRAQQAVLLEGQWFDLDSNNPRVFMLWETNNKTFPRELPISIEIRDFLLEAKSVGIPGYDGRGRFSRWYFPENGLLFPGVLIQSYKNKVHEISKLMDSPSRIGTQSPKRAAMNAVAREFGVRNAVLIPIR